MQVAKDVMFWLKSIGKGFIFLLGIGLLSLAFDMSAGAAWLGLEWAIGHYPLVLLVLTGLGWMVGMAWILTNKKW